MHKSRTFPGFGFLFQGLIASRSLHAGGTSRCSSQSSGSGPSDGSSPSSAGPPRRKMILHRGIYFWCLPSTVYRRLRWTINRPFPRKCDVYDPSYFVSSRGFLPDRETSLHLKISNTSGGYSMNPSQAAQVMEHRSVVLYLLYHSIHIQSYSGFLQSKYTVLHSIY